jgi:hypothetical protein
MKQLMEKNTRSNEQNRIDAKKFRPSKKHLAIFKRIAENGYYKPAYSDKEPATATLEKKGIVEWRDDFRGVKLTEYGEELVKVNGW